MEFRGERLKRLREAKHLSMTDLSDITGVSQSVISDLENGKKKTPRKATVERLCKGLGIAEEYFYLDGSRLPTEVLPDLPANVKTWLLSGDSIPWLVLSERASREGIPPETVQQLLDVLISAQKTALNSSTKRGSTK